MKLKKSKLFGRFVSFNMILHVATVGGQAKQLSQKQKRQMIRGPVNHRESKGPMCFPLCA